MFLTVGLGNPGQKYKNTRHNLGFRVVEEFSKKNSFSDFRISKKFNAEMSEGEIGGQKILLARPQTFMNNSGKSVKLLNSKFKILNSKLLVVHDDIDIPLGEIRIVKNRGAAGHQGVESIIKELKTKDFIRFRIGICPKNGKPKNPENFVLQKFKKDEVKAAEEVIQKSVEAIKMTTSEGLEKAMNAFNK